MRNVFVALLALSVLLVRGPLAMGEEPKTGGVTPEQIARWVDELDSDVFVVREKATEKLIEVGVAAIEPLAAVLPGSGLEVTTRAIYVLRELALSGDLEAEEGARQALDKVAAMRATAAARRAASTLATLDEIRQRRALEELEQLGAKVDKQRHQIGFQIEERAYAVEIGEHWRGQVQDLQRLKWLSEVHHLTLDGPRVTDDWLVYLDAMEPLQQLTIKRARISDAGLAHLRNLAALQELSLMYLPIGDGAIEHLQVHQGAAVIKLFGTEVTQQGAARLQEALAGVKIDHRQGAFLGVGCQQHPLGCAVVVVHPGSAADRAGLQPGDVILQYAGQETPDFETLTALIAEHRSGETVELQIQRGREKLDKIVALGQWD